jgi:O-antigen/teichoic acid export membrane protein
MRILFYCALAMLLPVAVCGYYLIALLYGEAYREAAWLFVLFSLKIVLVYPGLVYAKWYLVENMQKLTLFVSVCGAVLNILLNLVLIRSCGLFGAVIATIITNFCLYLIFPLPFKKGRFGVLLFLRSTLPVFLRRFREGRG